MTPASPLFAFAADLSREAGLRAQLEALREKLRTCKSYEAAAYVHRILNLEVKLQQLSL